jgi:tryptophanyl-tRNA synthetase
MVTEKETIDPWGSKIFNKYDNLYSAFGIQPVSEKVREYFRDTHLFERELIIGYRDFDKIMGRITKNEDFDIVSGFASSGEFHFGHKVVIDVYNYFRKFSKKGNFIICDLDAYTCRPDEKIPNMKKAKEYAIDNLANALALGVKKEDIRIQSKQTAEYFSFSHMISKKLTFNTVKATLGHDDLGKFASCYLQIADILYPQIENRPIPTLVPVGIDQEPIIRLTRDVAQKFSKQFGFEIPSSIYLAHVPGLTGYKEKMSKSKEDSAILLTEKEIDLKRIVSRALTGGRDTEEEQRRLGGTPEICPVFSLYKFHNPDSKFVKNIYDRCRMGDLLCGQDKALLKEFLIEFTEKHRKKYDKFVDIARKMLE